MALLPGLVLSAAGAARPPVDWNALKPEDIQPQQLLVRFDPTKAAPSAVSSKFLLDLPMRFTPRFSSSCCTWWLMVAWPTPRTREARVKLFSSTAVRNDFTCLRSKLSSFAI